MALVAGEYLKWDPCPLPCAWDFNAPLCPRNRPGGDCPVKIERVEIPPETK